MKRILLLTLLPLLTGCVAIAVGAAAAYGIIQYEGNEARRDYEAGLSPTYNACLAELKEMGYPVSTDVKPGPTEGKVEINDVWLRAEKLAEDSTRVRVRFGTFETSDHKRKAELLLKGVATRLGE